MASTSPTIDQQWEVRAGSPPLLNHNQPEKIAKIASVSSPAKPEISQSNIITPREVQPPSGSDADVILIPSYSRWFSWHSISECETRFLLEFCDPSRLSKKSSVYLYYRNSMIKQFRQNPLRKICFTDVRKTIVGDVGSIRRVFDFLETWGLINYSPSLTSRLLKWEEKDTKSTPPRSGSGGGALVDPVPFSKPSSVKICSGCHMVCSIPCFVSDTQHNALCARCYASRESKGGGPKADWAEKETLQLLEAIMNYGDDWKKVAQHVGRRSEKECIVRFLKLPFGEEFLGSMGSSVVDSGNDQITDKERSVCDLESFVSSPTRKKIRLTPLADASNPIMAQAAFLSALAGTRIADAAAQAAVTSLTEITHGISEGSAPFAEEVQEELDIHRSISNIIEVQMKEIQNKVVRFEEVELQMEKEWKQVEQLKNMLFVAQLNRVFHTRSQ